MKRMAILVIEPSIFRSILQLPPEAEITDLWMNIDRRGVLELKIDGAGWNVVEGEYIQRTTGTVKTDASGKLVVDWGFPVDTEQPPIADFAGAVYNHGKWQTIETAPQDGSVFLGYLDGKVREAYKSTRDGCEPWVFGGHPGSAEFAPRLKPTHWMPLPPQPDEA